jgi:hypothetical protein
VATLIIVLSIVVVVGWIGLILVVVSILSVAVVVGGVVPCEMSAIGRTVRRQRANVLVIIVCIGWSTAFMVRVFLWVSGRVVVIVGLLVLVVLLTASTMMVVAFLVMVITILVVAVVGLARHVGLG